MNSTRWLLDCTHVNGFSGIGNYALRMIDGMLRYGRNPFFVLLYDDQEVYFQKQMNSGINIIKLNRNDVYSSSNKIRRQMTAFPYSQLLEREGIDMVLTTCLTMNSIVFPKQYNQCAVIHDLQTIVLDKERYNWWHYQYNRQYMKWLYKRIPRLVTISEYVRSELKKFSGRDSHVIYNSVPVGYVTAESERLVKEPYILDVNSFSPYKNAELLMRAFSRICDVIPHRLYLKGLGANSDYCNYLRQLSVELCISDKVTIDGVGRTEQEMASLFKNASLVVSPSLMEGFGYTPIEAAIYGCPVLMSDIPTLREIGRGKLTTFNPYSVEDLAMKMRRILFNPPSCHELLQLSSFFAHEYSLKRQIKCFEEFLYKDK